MLFRVFHIDVVPIMSWYSLTQFTASSRLTLTAATSLLPPEYHDMNRYLPLQFPRSANSKFRAPTFSTRPARVNHRAGGGSRVYQPWRPRRPSRSTALARAWGVTTYRVLFTIVPIGVNHLENQLTDSLALVEKRSSYPPPALYRSVIAYSIFEEQR